MLESPGPGAYTLKADKLGRSDAFGSASRKPIFFGRKDDAKFFSKDAARMKRGSASPGPAAYTTTDKLWRQGKISMHSRTENMINAPPKGRSLLL